MQVSKSRQLHASPVQTELQAVNIFNLHLLVIHDAKGFERKQQVNIPVSFQGKSNS